VGFQLVMAGTEGAKIASIGGSAATPRDRMIDLAPTGGSSAAGKSTGLVTRGDVSAKDLGHGVGPSPVVEELSGHWVGDDALEPCIAEKFASDFSGECTCTDEFSCAIPQAKEGGEIDGQVDQGPRSGECRPDVILALRVRILALRVCG
jgi:hypothetical protein